MIKERVPNHKHFTTQCDYTNVITPRIFLIITCFTYFTYFKYVHVFYVFLRIVTYFHVFQVSLRILRLFTYFTYFTTSYTYFELGVSGEFLSITLAFITYIGGYRT